MTMNKNEFASRNGLLPGIIAPVNAAQLAIKDVFNMTPTQMELVSRLEVRNADLLAAFDTFFAEFRRYADDAMLSDAGKNAKRKELGEKFLADIDSIEHADADQWHSNSIGILNGILKSEIEAMPDPTNPVAEQRAREIRDLIRARPASERVAMYSQAAASEDWEFQAALERSPKFDPLLPADILERIQAERRERMHPVEVADANTYQAASDWLKAACAAPGSCARNSCPPAAGKHAGRPVLSRDGPAKKPR